MHEYAFSYRIQQTLVEDPALAYSLSKSKFFNLVVDGRQPHTLVRAKLAALEHEFPDYKCFSVRVNAPGQPLFCYKFSPDSKSVDDQFLVHTVLAF